MKISQKQSNLIIIIIKIRKNNIVIITSVSIDWVMKWKLYVNELNNLIINL